MSKKPETCLIIGAGMSGLLAARRLQQSGLKVTVLDKGRGLGGRMATRRILDGVFDHGAQFFTVRAPAFQDCVDEWLAEGAAQLWATGFASAAGQAPGDGYPRYRGSTVSGLLGPVRLEVSR